MRHCVVMCNTDIGRVHVLESVIRYDLTLPKRQILDPSKLKDLADDKLELNDNGKKFSNWVENTVGKGEIACYEQFLLFPQCFQKTCTADT